MDDPDALYQVSLHEIGHMLGLPHIVESGHHAGLLGDISIRGKAEKYLMYPVLSDQNLYSSPSDLEIKIATQYVLSHMPHPGVFDGCDYLCLTRD
jgi:hypothetical protein